MINPTPLLRPSPLDISGLFAGSFEALKRRFGLFILLVLAPTVLLIALLLIAGVIAGGAVATGNRSAITAAMVSAGLVVGIGSIVVVLLQYKVYGMMSLAAYEIAQGQRPDFRGLLARSKGFLPRMAPVILIFLGVLVAFYLLLFALTFALINSALDGSGSGAAAGVMVLLILLGLAAIPVAIILSIKLLYLIPAIAIEQLGGIDALKRSWRLTKGSFWRTFGYAILPQLAVFAISSVISMFTQFGGAALGQTPTSSDPAQAFMLLLAMLPMMTVSIVLQLAVQLFTTPFLQTYYTYMFIDQVRRSELPPQQYGYGQPGYGYPGAAPGGPGFAPQPPYPGQPYPPQQPPAQPGPAQPGPAQQGPPYGQAPGQQWPGQNPGNGQQWPRQDPPA
ncbi:MAG TPA: glycerophosphoryl diester phosphodiesterase membrane domain-containing protein [Micropruina sp.]|nr:glycerophosphoryl diester phosphodiesterase membrane domain-containing protein [Micropruina sp.]